MKEVEVLIKIKEKKKDVLAMLSKFNYSGKKEVFDIYFFDKKRESLKPKQGRLNQCFRLRKKDGINYIAYKVDIFDNKERWLYSEEEETEVKDFDVAVKIISHLGLEPLIEINNIKYTYYTDKYEIVLEDVKDLGLFLEVERLHIDDHEDIAVVKDEIIEFIKSLGVKFEEELNSGKPELMLKHQLNKGIKKDKR